MDKVWKLLKAIDDHDADTAGDEGRFHDLMMRKYERGEELVPSEVARLRRILRCLDMRLVTGVDDDEELYL